MKKTILYIEDDIMLLERAKRDLQNAFSNYNIEVATNEYIAIKRIPKDIESLALVCTDGNLFNELLYKTGTYGWDLAKQIRDLGFKGPIIYSGKANRPKNTEYLFDDVSEAKTGVRFIRKLKEYL